jgi:hypothetical protein
MELRGGGKGKDNDSQQYWNISVQVEDPMISIESGQIMGAGREGVTESNGRGWTDQSNVYSQEVTPLNIDFELIIKDRTVK